MSSGTSEACTSLIVRSCERESDNLLLDAGSAAYALPASVMAAIASMSQSVRLWFLTCIFFSFVRNALLLRTGRSVANDDSSPRRRRHEGIPLKKPLIIGADEVRSTTAASRAGGRARASCERDRISSFR